MRCVPGSGFATHDHRLRAVMLYLVARAEPFCAPVKDEEDMARRAWPSDLSIKVVVDFCKFRGPSEATLTCSLVEKLLRTADGTTCEGSSP